MDEFFVDLEIFDGKKVLELKCIEIYCKLMEILNIYNENILFLKLKENKCYFFKSLK